MSQPIIDKSIKIARQIFPRIYDPRKNASWHFAFAFKRTSLLAIGTNDMTYPNGTALRFAKRFKVSQEYPYLHAEVDLISRLWGKVYIDSSIKFVVIRLNKFGKLGNSKPCKNCTAILSALDIKKVYYSNCNGEIERLSL